MPRNTKYYTVEQANATLPLLRAILRDITELANNLRERHERLVELQGDQGLSLAHQEEADELVRAFERDQDRMGELEAEVLGLGVELKDYFTGLVDFRGMMHGREVYLCWRLGEPEVAHWHDLDAGFAGRRRLETKSACGTAPPR